MNGREIPDHLLKTATISQNMVEEEEEQSTNVFDLFRPRKMLLRTLNMFFQVLSIHQIFVQHQDVLGASFSLTTYF